MISINRFTFKLMSYSTDNPIPDTRTFQKFIEIVVDKFVSSFNDLRTKRDMVLICYNLQVAVATCNWFVVVDAIVARSSLQLQTSVGGTSWN